MTKGTIPKRVSAWGAGSLLALVLAGCAVDAQPQSNDESLASQQQPVIETRKFGTHCTESYESNWQAALPGAFTVCSRFNTEADNGSIFEFYYDLWNKQFYWHNTGDHADNSLEDVDLFFTLTHGGAINSTNAAWAMWNNGALATTSNMRLGDEGRMLSIFAQDSCETLKVDANTWARWDSVFAGGLRATVGSHGTLNLGTAEYDVGKVFAQRLNAGDTIMQAWFVANDTTAFNNQDTAVMYTGTNQSNCETRRGNMTWNNFGSYSRLRDSSIGYWCGWIWDDI
ncbi:MAG: DUF6345 domain-containing protein [Myxococcota bacterium]